MAVNPAILFPRDTTATKKVFQLRKRIRAVGGGAGASKTISILVWLIDYSQTYKSKVATVVSRSFPHLEGGAIRDFKAIMMSRGYWDDQRWNETKHFYQFETGSIMEFKSFDTYGKSHGPRRDVLFLNEANYIPYIIADQLITRTKEVVWMDWNPTEEFWFYTELQGKRQDVDFLKLTYLDNEGLPDGERLEIEAHKENKNWWQVYGLGELGVIEGRIYTDWKTEPEVPHFARLECYGLDWGYSNDPTAIVAVYYFQGGYVFDEICFQKGLSNKQVADILLNQKSAPVIPDSAEPKSNDELKGYGLTVIPAEKGQDSVKHGIATVQAQRISVTERSLNILREYRNYMWQTDKLGKIINEPDHGFSHSMDAIRYGINYLVGKPKITFGQASPLPVGHYPEIGL